MLTTDLSLRIDPAYEKISRRFYENPDQFADAFARAWFKLTHRDMGPRVRYLGPLVPKETLIWQDPIPAVDHPLIGEQDVAALKAKILGVRPDGVAARLDRLGVGVDVPRLRQARRRQRRAHSPQPAEGLGGQPAGPAQDGAAEARRRSRRSFGKKVSLADLIVLGGCAAVEKAAKDAGVDVKVPFTPGRMDASQEQTDVQSFAPLEPRADGFRNYISGKKHQFMAPEEALVDRAQLLTADGAGDDGAGRRPARARRECRRLQARRLHQAAGQADQRLLRQPARHEHGVAARPATTCTRAATARPRRSSGPAPAST